MECLATWSQNLVSYVILQTCNLTYGLRFYYMYQHIIHCNTQCFYYTISYTVTLSVHIGEQSNQVLGTILVQSISPYKVCFGTNLSFVGDITKQGVAPSNLQHATVPHSPNPMLTIHENKAQVIPCLLSPKNYISIKSVCARRRQLVLLESVKLSLVHQLSDCRWPQACQLIGFLKVDDS